LFVSTQSEATGTEQKEFIKRCFAQAASMQPTGEPLDWKSDTRPTHILPLPKNKNFIWFVTQTTFIFAFKVILEWKQ
jgi:alpha-galactosidase